MLLPHIDMFEKVIYEQVHQDVYKYYHFFLLFILCYIMMMKSFYSFIFCPSNQKEEFTALISKHLESLLKHNLHPKIHKSLFLYILLNFIIKIFFLLLKYQNNHYK